ncbi:hypothetical protein MBLNU457_g0079t2 [Dothideomycetes sp. NU457]
MSTPSTATITVPPNHQYYTHPAQYLPPMTDYHHNAAYPTGPSRPTNQPYATSYTTAAPQIPLTASVGAPRPASSHARQSQSQASQYYDAPSSSQAMASTKKRSRDEPVDWQEFFGGKPPKEIICIDDTPPPTRAVVDETQAMAGAAAPLTNGSARHADKRRKTDKAPAYNTGFHAQTAYSNTQTPYYDDSSRQYSGSTDRTTSYNTTAATSLGSSTSASYLDDVNIGQKRKRATRATVADQKRREFVDPFEEYVPPPKPPIKAKDVHVQVIPDRTASRDQKVDDDDGHYVVVEKADLTERYSIMKLLGQGTFGKVVKAYDRHRRKEVAVKIIRSIQKYRDASRIELRVLSTLACNDKNNRNKCIHLRDTFDFRNHICIVTDLLGQSVFDFLKGNQFVPFPSSHIQQFARQLFTSVAFLHDLNLIHTDLKPENILLVNGAYQTFTYNRVIPSSSASTSRSAKLRKVLLDPEIRLIDFGCILVEFFTGDALFQTHDNLEHLAMMEAVCAAPIDKALVRTVTKAAAKNPAAAYFKRQVLDFPQSDTTRSSKKFVKALKQLQEIIPSHNQFGRLFLDLLKRIFVYDPKKRITAKEALKHPWFRESYEDDGTEADKIRVERDRQAAIEEARMQQRR